MNLLSSYADLQLIDFVSNFDVFLMKSTLPNKARALLVVEWHWFG